MTPLSRLIGWLIAAALFLRRRGKRRPPDPGPPPDPRERAVGTSRRAETGAALLMLLAGLCGAAFPVIYAISADPQLLGLSIGLALIFAAAAAVIVGKAVVPRETAVEERARLGEGEEQDGVVDDLAGAGDGVTRRGALVAAGGVAGLGLCAAAVAPLASLGPRVGRILHKTPWRRGIRLVDEHDRPLRASSIAVGEFLTAFPEGADKEELGSPVVVVRLLPAQFHMTAQQMAGVVDGLVAYSKICTHAACAVSMFRYPVSQGTTPSKPALVCPCHYSTFNPGKAAKVEFGPASRPLPQLPLAVDAAGLLVAGGDFEGAIGPSWWGVRQ